MFTEKRLARKRAANERLKLMMAQELISEKYCESCPLRNDHRDPQEKCGGCKVFTELREIGKKLDKVNKEKRKFSDFEEPEEEKVIVHTGDFLKAEKYLTVTKTYNDNLGFSFKKGDRFVQKKNMQGNKIQLTSADGKDVLITQHRYYNNFKGIKKEEFLIPKTEYVCIKSFANREGLYIEMYEVWHLTNKHTSKNHRVMRQGEREVKISKQVFYKNFERA